MDITKTDNIFCNSYKVANTNITIIDFAYNDTINYCFIKDDIVTIAQFKIDNYSKMYDLQIYNNCTNTDINNIIKTYLHKYYEV